MKILHYLETGQYTYLAGEINALYHEAAFKIFCMSFVRKVDNACKVKSVSLQVSVARQSIQPFAN